MAHTYGNRIDDDDPPEDSENYRESSDDDFNPTAAPAEDSSSSSADEAPEKATKTQRKRKRKAEPQEDLDSGDEATIGDAKRRRERARAKKFKGKSQVDDDEEDEEDDELMLSDDGGEGGLIKTRAQRKVEKVERKPLARVEGATVDVDALWAQMLAAPLKSVPTAQLEDKDKSEAQQISKVKEPARDASKDDGKLVSMRRIYTFAGQRTTEDKQVPPSLVEQHVSDGWKTIKDGTDETADGPVEEVADEPADMQSKIRRPVKRPSRFEPNPTGFVRTLPPEHQLTWPRAVTAVTTTGLENAPLVDGVKSARPEKAQKLNVVDKSRLDWTGFVDKEGISEELKKHGKTKESYMGRMQFLAGVEARREEERRQMKTAAAP